MGQALIQIDAMAGARALADQGAVTGGDGDPHPGDVGDAPAAFAITPHRPFVFSNAAADQGGALPAVKTKDPVGFCNHLPALEVADPAAALLSLAHVGAIERGRKQGDLSGGEAGGGPFAMG